jgi:hypothetical protein
LGGGHAAIFPHLQSGRAGRTLRPERRIRSPLYVPERKRVPASIVDHKVQRARALRIYRQEQPGVEANSSMNRSGSDGAATWERPDQE